MYSGINIKIARKKAGFSNAEKLAQELGCSRQLIYKWEKDQARPNAEMLGKLSEVLKCDTDYLAGASNTPVRAYNEYSEYTGLSPAAIEALHNLSNEDSGFCKVLSDLILEGDIIAMLTDIQLARKISNWGIIDSDMEKERQLRELQLWEKLRNFKSEI